MRKFAVLALTLVSLQAASAAVLPFDLDTRAGGARILAQGGPVGAQAGQPAAYRGDWSADSRNTWRDDDGEPRVQFNLRSNAGDNRWGFGVRLRDLAGLPSSALSSTADNIQFTWTREAGAFRFSGSFDQGRGNGTYTFTPDASFVTNMGSAGYRSLSIDDIVRLAVIDVTVAHVRGLAQAGYGSMSLDDVIRTRIHRVTPDYIKGMREVGFVTVSEEQLVRMKIHKVDAQFIRDARADGLSVQTPGDAVDLAIHGPRWRKRR